MGAAKIRSVFMRCTFLPDPEPPDASGLLKWRAAPDQAWTDLVDATVGGRDIRGASREQQLSPPQLTIYDVIHACPPKGSGTCPCCGLTPFELPNDHRLTLNPENVTCTSQKWRP